MHLRSWRLWLLLLVGATGIWLSLGKVGNFLYQRGLVAQREWRLDDAARYFTWSTRLQSNNHAASYQLGLTRQLQGDFLTSQQILSSLLVKGVTNKEILSQIHNSIGINQYSFASPDEAIKSHELSLKLADEIDDKRLRAHALIGLGRALYHSKGKVDEATARVEEAKTIAREIDDKGLEAAAVRNLGVINWWFRAELDRPLKDFYLPALELYRSVDDQRGVATMLSLIALIFNSKGDVYNFFKYQSESIAIQERIGEQAGLSDSYMHMGMLYGGLGNYRKAREYYSRSLTITRKIGYRLAQLDLESLLAGVHVNLGEYDEAIDLYDPALTHLANTAPLVRTSDVAYCYQLKGDYSRALALYQSVLKSHKQQAQPDVRFELTLLISSAECFLALGDWANAEAAMKNADVLLNTFEPHSGGDLRAATLRARIARHHDLDREALQHLTDALTVEGRIFAVAQSNLLIPPDPRTYEQLFILLLEYSSSGDVPNARIANELIFRFLENMRYRSLRNFIVRSGDKQQVTAAAAAQESELLKQIQELANRNLSGKYRQELRELYSEYEDLTLKHQLGQPQQFAIRAAKPMELVNVQRALDPETVLVEFLIVGDRVIAVVVSGDELQCLVLAVDKQTLAAKTKLLRSLLQSSKGNEWPPVAESLRSLLFGPLEQTRAFSGKRRVGLAPSGVLNDLPFAALVRLDQGQAVFLIEEYQLFQVSSATAHAHEQQDSARSGMKTVAFGLNAAQQGTPLLKFAEAEALAVADVTYLGAQALESELKRVAPESDYLHLATHAVAESDMPLFSRIILQPSGRDDGSLTVREVFELGLKTQLVTLSGCETGRSYSVSGTDRTDQDRIGLIEAFLQAGSKSVLSTLWPITDEPTTEFMKYFYKELRAGRRKAEALANAQRAMLRSDTSHPRYWAPFILTGQP